MERLQEHTKNTLPSPPPLPAAIRSVCRMNPNSIPSSKTQQLLSASRFRLLSQKGSFYSNHVPWLSAFPRCQPPTYSNEPRAEPYPIRANPQVNSYKGPDQQGVNVGVSFLHHLVRPHDVLLQGAVLL